MRRILFVLAIALTLPGSAWAQTPPALDRIEELARAGRTGEARELLSAWWDNERPDAGRRDIQRGFWLRGRLTVDPQLAAADFQRLIVEYPGGVYADQALLRLAQTAHALGDGTRAAELVRRLVTDHPRSAVRREAEAWLSNAGAAPQPPVVATAAPTPASGGPPIAANPRSTASDPRPAAANPSADASGAPRPRVDTVPVPPADSSLTRSDLPDAGAVTSSTGAYAVQFGAFLDESRAWALANRIVNAGLQPRVVRIQGNDLVRVRVGRFDAIGDASDLLQQAERLGFTAAIVRDANREEAIGDG